MSNRRMIKIRMTVLAAALLVVTQVQTATAATPTYAAYAYGITTRTVAYATGNNPVEAQAAAEAACRAQGGRADCQGVGWWTNS
jgi:hypothetical protein